jgi:nucleoside-diphosphate-sugar epimerase
MKHTLFITGAAGYVGAMLCDQFSKREDVERIFALDKEPLPELLLGNEKIEWMTGNTADGTWQKRAAELNPDIIIHTAWQIREIYGNRPLSWKWNIDGSDAIFDFAFSNASVRRLIHFSTVASYGAYPNNSMAHRFTEEEPFRRTDYLYAEEKRIAEEHLLQKYEMQGKHVAVSIVRPAAITGPRGRFMRIRFGLQSALSGQLSGNFLYNLVSVLVSWVPATKGWLRQFVHEDDVNDIVAALAFDPVQGTYEIYNLCPPGPSVLSADMAKAVGKRRIFVPPSLVRIAYFFLWHLSRGRIPTAQGAWKSYSYPIAVDGSKVTKVLGYRYRMPSLEAFVSTKGRYEYAVPEALRKP